MVSEVSGVGGEVVSEVIVPLLQATSLGAESSEPTQTPLPRHTDLAPSSPGCRTGRVVWTAKHGHTVPHHISFWAVPQWPHDLHLRPSPSATRVSHCPQPHVLLELPSVLMVSSHYISPDGCNNLVTENENSCRGLLPSLCAVFHILSGLSNAFEKATFYHHCWQISPSFSNAYRNKCTTLRLKTCCRRTTQSHPGRPRGTGAALGETHGHCRAVHPRQQLPSPVR